MSYLGDRLHPWLRSLLLPQCAIRQKLPRGNLLTPSGSPTIVLEESTMKSPKQHPGIIVALRRCNWICLVLATLLLYNPFFTALRSGHNPEVCHPISHRASVGSSELQQFSPIDGWGSLPAVNAAATAVVLPLPEISARFLPVLHPIAGFPQQFFGPGLWFRPPPVR